MDHRRRLGTFGEAEAIRHLWRAGYVVLDRNFRSRFGELDVVAERGGCLVFCEVKTRLGPARGELGPLAGVNGDKQRRVRRMAREWLASGRAAGRRGGDQLRFDAIGVSVRADGSLLALEHVEDAF